MRTLGRYRLVAATALVLVVVPQSAAAHQTVQAGKPVYRNAPTRLPATRIEHRVCTVERHQRPLPTRVHGLVTVSRRATGVVALGLPGIDPRHCRAAEQRSGARLARRLGREIRRAPNQADGPESCGPDNGATMALYFMYRHRHDEYVGMSLACRFVVAPGRDARPTTGPMDRTLKRVAPAGWRHYFG